MKYVPNSPPRRLSPEEQAELEGRLEAREDALREIAQALYQLAQKKQKLQRRYTAICRGNDEIRRQLRRLPVEPPAVNFISITEAAREERDQFGHEEAA
jgi:hypothetical protein